MLRKEQVFSNLVVGYQNHWEFWLGKKGKTSSIPVAWNNKDLGFWVPNWLSR